MAAIAIRGKSILCQMAVMYHFLLCFFYSVSSTEFVSIGEPPIPGPDLPFNASQHCMIQYASNSILLIGGLQDGCISGKTWIINPENGFEIKEGPPLNIARYRHSCAKMVSPANGKVLIIVAGGINKAAVKSVEIWDPASNEGWTFGPSLPFPSKNSAMVTSPDGLGVVLIGGYNYFDNHFSSALIELRDALSNWVVLEQKVKHIRKHHVALQI